MPTPHIRRNFHVHETDVVTDVHGLVCKRGVVLALFLRHWQEFWEQLCQLAARIFCYVVDSDRLEGMAYWRPTGCISRPECSQHALSNPHIQLSDGSILYQATFVAGSTAILLRLACQRSVQEGNERPVRSATTRDPGSSWRLCVSFLKYHIPGYGIWQGDPVLAKHWGLDGATAVSPLPTYVARDEYLSDVHASSN